MAEENRLPLEESRVGGSRPKRVYRPIEERIALIRQDAEEGVPCVELIVQIEGITRGYVHKLAREAGIVLPKKGYHGHISPVQKIANIRQAIQYKKANQQLNPT